MQDTGVFGPSCPADHAAALAEEFSVALVNLMAVRVSARGILNRPEHERRSSLSMNAVTDPALLGCLLELPIGRPVMDPVIWAQTSGQPQGVVARGADGRTVTRLLEPALIVEDVIVPGPPGREMLAVQDASFFASFTSRWVSIAAREVPDAVVMEAKLCGVGLLDQAGRVILPAEKPQDPAVDGWAWLLWEKTYKRWIKEQTAARATGNPAQATGAATEEQTG